MKAACWRYAMLGCVLAAAGTAPAQTSLQKFNLNVLRVFSEGQSGGGFYPVQGIPECTYGLIYVDLSTPSGRGQLALLIQAKSQGLKLSRVDYQQLASGTCHLTGLHVE